ncbi:K+ transport system, NAD-binding component [Geoglobus ahangari]|uniref:K+ transport system, NAD-binding component n=1 Tax=Geoglobus ahangari TaxID=113653 RepID=A0A0F7IF19_9EURY|nr:NAD-binding protein [Geoglobus ahangari]AKG91024.1 K+ transport system, NAD-binding component [Geoglobus ahangari]
MRVLLIGFGDVGRATAKILLSKNVEVTAIDTRDIHMDGVDFLRRDALSEELWEEIDLEKFSSAIIALPNDVDALLCIMMLRKKKEDLLILARCNNPEYREKMSIAGADYVIDISTISSQMVISSIFREEAEKKLFYENIHIRTYKIEEGSAIVGKRIEELKDDVLVLAYEKDGKVYESGAIEAGSTLAVVGKMEDLKKFEERFITPGRQ